MLAAVKIVVIRAPRIRPRRVSSLGFIRGILAKLAGVRDAGHVRNSSKPLRQPLYIAAGTAWKTGETGEESIDPRINRFLTGLTGLSSRARRQIEWPAFQPFSASKCLA